jgi:hypothetical protein
VLQYYWYIESEGVSTMTGNIIATCNAADVLGNTGNYVGARLRSGDTNWEKYIGAFDVGNSRITYPFTDAANLTGEYTAGEDPAFGDVVTYETVASGDWDDPTRWVRSDAGEVPASGPTGGYVIINEGHTINTNGNRRNSYALTLNGRLDIGTTYGHNLNRLDGTGTLSLDFNTLPAGNLNAFFSCTGGTMEYGGTTSYNIRIDYPIFRNLTITGTGSIGSPSINTFAVCEKLLITSAATLRQRDKANYFGDIELENGGKYSNPGYWTNLIGSLPQTISGDFTGTNAFKTMLFGNNSGYDILNDIEVYNYIQLNLGRFRNGGRRFNYMSTTGITNEQGGSANTYIEGKYRRLLPNNASTHFFPVGKPEYKKVTGIIAPAGVSNSYWTLEYMANNPFDDGYDTLKVVSPISRVTQTEYWKIEGPNTYTARLRLTLTGTSNVANEIDNLSDLRILRWNPGIEKWEVVGGTVAITGNAANGTLTCNQLITFDGTTQIFTIGSVKPATAEFTDGTATICPDDSTPLEVTFEGTAPFSITYTINGASPTTISGITDNPYSFNVSPVVNSVYTLTAMTHAYGDGIIIGDPISITVRTRPTATISALTTPLCDGESADIEIELTAGDPQFNFIYSVNGANQPEVLGVNSPYEISGHGPLSWISVGAPPAVYTDYVFRIERIEDINGCVNEYAGAGPEATVRVYKIPETGPQYHVPNTFGE